LIWLYYATRASAGFGRRIHQEVRLDTALN